jgi:hypothetical protein
VSTSNTALYKRVSSWGKKGWDTSRQSSIGQMFTKVLVPKKHKDALEAIIGSKDTYRLVVTQKGVLVQYDDSYLLLATHASLK